MKVLLFDIHIRMVFLFGFLHRLGIKKMYVAYVTWSVDAALIHAIPGVRGPGRVSCNDETVYATKEEAYADLSKYEDVNFWPNVMYIEYWQLVEEL